MSIEIVATGAPFGKYHLDSTPINPNCVKKLKFREDNPGASAYRRGISRRRQRVVSPGCTRLLQVLQFHDENPDKSATMRRLVAGS